MAEKFYPSKLLIFVTLLLSFNHSEQLQSSQPQTLLRIKRLLNFPSALSSWNSSTDFCSPDSDSSLTVVCYEDTITQLHIIGEKRASPLPKNFSTESFVATLARLPHLKVLTLVSLGIWGPLPGKIARLSSLEIVNMSSNFLYGVIPQELSLLSNLQTLILDDNMFSGKLPDWIDSLPALTVLSLKNNLFNGSVPDSLGSLENLRILSLSHNHFYGAVPDLRHLTNLQVLELDDNAFGPQFPRLGTKLVTLVLRNNSFRSSVPAEVTTFHQLERFDISSNSFVGPFHPALLSLPSIIYLNISGNQLTGMLFENLTCSSELQVVDLSSNLLTGSLPGCLQSKNNDKTVLYARNCLQDINQNQHLLPFCHTEALAVGILPESKKHKDQSKVGLSLGIVGGILGVAAFVALVFSISRRGNVKSNIKNSPTRLILESATPTYSSKHLSDARYISQTMKLATVGLPGYRTFSLEEIVVATNNFDTSSFMGESSQGQMYRGRLRHGILVAIRCVKMKKRYSIHYFMHHIELISQLRHRHLVCALGHCFEYYLEDSTVSRIFLVFEYVPNGTLRSWISDRRSKKSLGWTQRIGAAIGVAKGIQYLHTGIIPGVYSNNLKTTDVLMDQNLGAKICSYNLPFLSDMGKVEHGTSSSGSKNPSVNESAKHEDKSDIYDFGAILQEMILGRAAKSRNEADGLRVLFQASIIGDEEARRSIVDAGVRKSCLDQSLKTMMEICARCLAKDPVERPSIEDVLWNLQFAAQVQDAWRGESQSSEGSPGSPFEPRRLTFH
ncbi:probable inactive leucine-rich repeat receptor-like protein kinase At3g03770 isoform X2 [Neltuma alba]|uniref:probable inactive leucine-rich repeat receptor-like protein kinase At3g03770 isoform X2 n=1 Tax=Neltuma alba TaxID=207710 RepID=UPI0010A33124|nr:probable inactive leucine-rich repeat receptor-like protein kinase At3g03770 isoform X2 [Prosopis alba]